jgi:hypothetical protein
MAWRKSSWAKAVFSSSAFLFGSSRKKQPYRTRLLLEPLEDRCVPTTFTPTTFADGVLGSGSLRDGVLQFNADAGSGDDTIQLLAGTYALTIVNTGGHHETAGLEGDLNITNTSHRLIIQGAGSSTIIDASQLQDRVFQIVNPGTVVVFQDLVITGGLAQDDGSDGALAGSTDALGGGILNNGGDVTLDNVVVQNNVARGGDGPVLGAPGHNARGGGLYSTGGALTMAGATLADNQAIGGRGGDASGSGYYVPGGVGGSAGGGGLYATGGSLDVSDSMITSNRATGGRGGDGSHTFSGGHTGGDGGTGQGGGLYVSGGSLAIATSTIASNQGAGGPGGAYGLPGECLGGGLYNTGTLTVSSVTLSGNSATTSVFIARGGGLYNDASGTLMISDSILSGNSAPGGGGIGNAGTLTVSNSTLSSNTGSYGGGIGNGGTLTVSNSTLFDNYAGDNGGGIYNYNGTLTVSNTTLSGNYAYYDSGGIFNYSNQAVTLTNVTLTANRANHGGGSSHGGGLFVYSGSSVPVLHNTLIAGNFRGATGTTRDDVYGALDPGGDYNLIGDGTGMTGLSNGVNGNLVGSAADPIDPLLGPLQDNGGRTQTMALLPGSPALNAGDPAQLGVADQRGVVRAGGVNIGAYQASAGNFVLTASDSVAAGVPFDLTLKAVDTFGQTALGYLGTVTFSATDNNPAVMLPADYPFTAADAGLHTFAGGVTLVTAGSQTLTASDTTTSSITGSTAVAVTPAAADHFMICVPAGVSSGTPFDVTVTVVDAYGNTVPTYLGTVHFSNTDPDPGVILPPDYTFQASDGGSHVFAAGVTLITPGDETLTVADTGSGLSGNGMIHVS